MLITTHRNEFGYWVARSDDGDYRGTKAWAVKKKNAVNILLSTLGAMGNVPDEAK